VVNVGDEISVKVIDIDLERRRISLSLKQATEGTIGEAVGFDPSQYGMEMQYDEGGNYIYPEGFDQETGEWKEGFESQRDEWERQYAEAHARWEAQQAQLAAQAAAAAEAAASAPAAASYSSETPEETAGTLAGHDDLAALREQLAATTDAPAAEAPAEAAAEAPAESEPETEPAAE
ncbi:MAG: small subunit ribosomal protein, partial [Frankiaceae bacterium]|nr:small subunit ribosomal protein [Frankiaceae bacterium]